MPPASGPSAAGNSSERRPVLCLPRNADWGLLDYAKHRVETKGGATMPVKQLKDFLDENGVKYITISHSRAFTAQEIAAIAHIPGKEMAKTVMVKVDGKMAMAVLPASHRVDFDRLKTLLGAKSVELASEDEFKAAFPSCEVGAMPPFGNLYGMDTYVSKGLVDDDEIVFNAGLHTELIRLSYKDYDKLVTPKVLKFSVKR
jgi:Ala-tRNA(Pro) deacylase